MRILLMTEPVTARPATAGARYALEMARAWRQNPDCAQAHELVVLTTETDADSLGVRHPRGVYGSAQWSFRTKLQLWRSLPALMKDCSAVQTFFTPRPLTERLFARALENAGGRPRVIRVAPNVRGWVQGAGRIRADAIVASSTYAHMHLGQVFGEDKLHHITPGVRGDYLADAGEPADRTPAMCVYPGDMQDLVRAECVLDACAAIRREYPDFTLHILARMRDRRDRLTRDAFLKAIAARDLEDCVRIPALEGDRFRTRLAAARVVVFPVAHLTKKFDIPFSILDAMALGRPAVVSDTGPLGELASRGGAVVVPPNDAEALAEALIRMLADDDFRTRLGADAKAGITEYFSASLMVRAYKSLYDALSA